MKNKLPLTEEQLLARKRRLIGLAVLVPLIALIVWIVVFAWNFMGQFSGGSTTEQIQAFSDYLDQFGWFSWIIMIAIEIVQIVVAVVPGGITETAAGFLFGPFWGTLLSVVAIFLAYTLVFWMVKKFGIKLVGLFIDPHKIDELKFINSETRLLRTVFILYLIPALPKDAFTYFFGLTRIRWRDFILLSLIGRLPTLVATISFGWQLSEGELWKAVIIVSAIFICSFLGVLWYSRYTKKKKSSANE
ncbi:MAG: TVP38/TMEM64 family protein [Clostridia bacterium]|nr:TVP38/TMEM64 family protein [Clostridia bacterium]